MQREILEQPARVRSATGRHRRSFAMDESQLTPSRLDENRQRLRVDRSEKSATMAS